MTLKNEPRNNRKGWTTSKKALLASAAFIITGDIAQARVEVDTTSDVFGISSPTLAKQYPYVMNDPKSATNLLEQPLLEVLKDNLSPTITDALKKASLIQDDTKGDESGISPSTLEEASKPIETSEPTEDSEVVYGPITVAQFLKDNLPPTIADTLTKAYFIKDDAKGDESGISSSRLAGASKPIEASEPTEDSAVFYGPITAGQFLQESDRFHTDNVQDFATLAYYANQQGEWVEEGKEIYTRLIAERWELCPFNGITGVGNYQVESVSGVIAFKDHDVIISTRGTEMANIYDWLTNFHAFDGTNVEKLSSAIAGMFSGNEANTASPAEKVFGNLTEEEFKRDIHPGFRQTHLSSWDAIWESILNHAKSLSVKEKRAVSPQDFRFITTGHSLGGAKAQLNAVWLAKMLGPENKGNIDTIVFGSPRVFGWEAAKEVNQMIADDRLHITRIENYDASPLSAGNPFANDFVTYVPPKLLGYGDAGDSIDDNNGWWLLKHLMSNITRTATRKTDTLRANTLVVRQEAPLAAREIVQDALINAIAPVDFQTGNTIDKTIQKREALDSARFVARFHDALFKKLEEEAKVNDGQADVQIMVTLIRKAKEKAFKEIESLFAAPQSDLPKAAADIPVSVAASADSQTGDTSGNAVQKVEAEVEKAAKAAGEKIGYTIKTAKNKFHALKGRFSAPQIDMSKAAADISRNPATPAA